MIKEIVVKLKEQKKQLAKVISQKPTNNEQKVAIKKTKALLKKVNKTLEVFNA